MDNEDVNIDVSQISSDILLEFLEAAIHNLLYVRQLYPPGVFTRCKKYDVPIQVCIHPEVKTYIANLVTSLRPLVDKNELEYVAFVILPEPANQAQMNQQPIERFVFDVAIPSSKTLGDDKFLLQIEQALRSFLLKLNVCDSLLKLLPEDASWTVQVKTVQSSVLEMQENQRLQDFQWIKTDDAAGVVPNASLIPLRAMDAKIIKMQLYVEEGV